jgi:hypothetical protein
MLYVNWILPHLEPSPTVSTIGLLMIGFHAFGMIRVTFKRANAKIPIIHIPPLGHYPPLSHPTLSFYITGIPEGGSNRESPPQLLVQTSTHESGNA